MCFFLIFIAQLSLCAFKFVAFFVLQRSRNHFVTLMLFTKLLSFDWQLQLQLLANPIARKTDFWCYLFSHTGGVHFVFIFIIRIACFRLFFIFCCFHSICFCLISFFFHLLVFCLSFSYLSFCKYGHPFHYFLFNIVIDESISIFPYFSLI